MVYFAHFYSHISYGIFYWGSSLSMRNIFIIQRRAFRITLRLVPRISHRGNFKKLDTRTVTCLCVYALMLFAVKNLNIYQTNSSVQDMNTRQHNKLHIPSVRLSSIQRGVCCSSVKIFNQPPQNIFRYCNNIRLPCKNAFYFIEEFPSADHNNVDT
jgi:hypothetical protein